ncbi:hypothetical protein N431DRAFT_122358 [Stipitochalara longipes BDJ]|nr:hypothetical protein N431DRAFT_122358 [Stipitochalara longipes BDJ]
MGAEDGGQYQMSGDSNSFPPSCAHWRFSVLADHGSLLTFSPQPSQRIFKSLAAAVRLELLSNELGRPARQGCGIHRRPSEHSQLLSHPQSTPVWSCAAHTTRTRRRPASCCSVRRVAEVKRVSGEWDRSQRSAASRIPACSTALPKRTPVRAALQTTAGPPTTYPVPVPVPVPVFAGQTHHLPLTVPLATRKYPYRRRRHFMTILANAVLAE